HLQRQQSRITTQPKTRTPPELSDASDVRACVFASVLSWDLSLSRPAPQLAKRQPGQPVMKSSLDLHSPEAKRQLRNRGLERSPAMLSWLVAQEMFVGQLVFSSARAGSRCRPCSYGHKGSTMRR